jgi:hypothetical protein
MRAAWVPAGALAALAALAAGGGCTKILGLDYTYQATGGGPGTTAATGTGTGGASACGSFVWDQEPVCQGCVEKSCCAELHACDTGTPCALIAACARLCKPGDDACLTACINEDSNKHAGSGLSAYDALSNCWGKNCNNTLTGCSFPVCTSTYNFPTRACAACLTNDAGCCAALTACSTDPVCQACVQNNTAMGCSANMNFQKVWACVTVTCGIVCSYEVCGSPAFGYYADDCNYCVSKPTGGCCSEFNACVMNTSSTCYMCMLGTTATGCSTDMLYTAYNNCVTANCNIECAGF